MNKCEAAAAIQAWTMAINHKLAIPTEKTPIEELAQMYGKAISKPEHIDEASHLFNWVEIINLIDQVQR
jgi:hypothetical protein